MRSQGSGRSPAGRRRRLVVGVAAPAAVLAVLAAAGPAAAAPGDADKLGTPSTGFTLDQDGSFFLGTPNQSVTQNRDGFSLGQPGQSVRFDPGGLSLSQYDQVVNVGTDGSGSFVQHGQSIEFTKDGSVTVQQKPSATGSVTFGDPTTVTFDKKGVSGEATVVKLNGSVPLKPFTLDGEAKLTWPFTGLTPGDPTLAGKAELYRIFPLVGTPTAGVTAKPGVRLEGTLGADTATLGLNGFADLNAYLGPDANGSGPFAQGSVSFTKPLLGGGTSSTTTEVGGGYRTPSWAVDLTRKDGKDGGTTAVGGTVYPFSDKNSLLYNVGARVEQSLDGNGISFKVFYNSDRGGADIPQPLDFGK
ncbi:MAG TPA: hypothetical protein VKP11_08245 [Frankiaceae bacterium]|nr:hypothetical protein [Frankiaceae bacterium]